MICGVSFNCVNNLFNKILVFDLDDTLINAQAIKDILFNFAGKSGCPRERAQNIYRNIRDDGFTLEKYTEALSGVVDKKAEDILGRIRAEIIRCKDALVHKDALEFLELCKSKQTRLHLLTFGASSWQKEKIQMFGLDKYFQEAIFTDNEASGKLRELEKIIGDGTGEQVVLFNDKLKEIVAILERYPEIVAYLRPVGKIDDELWAVLDPSLRQRIEVLPNFRLLSPEIYV